MVKIVLAMLLASSFVFGYEMDYDKETNGVVRHMKVYKDPKWVSKIELKNGKKLFFVSPKSMIEFYLQPGKWSDIGVKSEDDFKDIASKLNSHLYYFRRYVGIHVIPVVHSTVEL